MAVILEKKYSRIMLRVGLTRGKHLIYQQRSRRFIFLFKSTGYSISYNFVIKLST